MAATTKCLARICQTHMPHSNSSKLVIRAISSPTGKCLTIVTHGDDHIKIIINGVLKAFIKCPYSVQALALHTVKRHVHAAIALSDGSVYMIDLTGQMRAAKRDVRKGDHVNQQVSLPETHDAIFSDLLHGTDSTGLHSSRSVSSLAPPTEPVIYLTQDHKIITCQDKIEEILVLDNFFIVLTIAENSVGWKCQCYSQEISLQNPCQVYFIPKTSPWDVYEGDQSEKVNFVEMPSLPKLYCIIPKCFKIAKKEVVPSENERVLEIENTLYNQLFSIHSNIMEIPMVLVLLPNGQLYSCPVRGVLQEQYCKPWLHYDLHQDAVSLHMIHYDQDSTDINLDFDTNQQVAQDCLLLVGAYGKVVLIKPANPSTVCTEHQLPSQVFHSLVHHHSVLYSCGRDLHWADLSPLLKSSTNPKEKEETKGIEGTQLIIHNCGFANILCMVKHKQQSAAPWISTDKTQILAVNKKGHILHLEVDSAVSSKPPRGQHTITASTGGQRLKDMVTGIGRISGNMKDLHSVLSAQQVALNQLAIASSIAVENAPHRGTEKNNDTITCKVSLHSRDLGWQVEHTVQISIENSSPFMLTPGWTLLVNFRSFSDGSSQLDDLSETKSLVLGTMPPCSQKLMDISLAGHSPLRLPIQITPILHFNAQSCMNAFCDRVTDSSDLKDQKDDTTVCIPLHSTQLNILNFLCPIPSMAPVNHTSKFTLPTIASDARQSNNFADMDLDTRVISISKERRPHLFKERIDDSVAGEKGVSHPALRGYSISLMLSRQQVKALSSGGDSPEGRLLQIILENNQNFPRNSLTESSVRGITPSGHQVSMTIHKNSPDGVLAVSIHSPTVELLSQLRMAVSQIIQNLSRSSQDEDIPIIKLRKSLNQIEDLGKELQCMEDELVVSEPHVPRDLTTRMYSLYENLRNVHLPV